MNPSYAFISYSSLDRAAAFRVCERLEADGLTCWIAPRDVAAGVQYPAAIFSAVKDAKAVVLLMSATSVASPHVMRELVLAVDHGVPILPLRIETIEAAGPFRYLIAGQQLLDALPPPIDGHLARIGAAAKALMATDTSHTGSGAIASADTATFQSPPDDGRPNRHTARPDDFIGRTVGTYDIQDYLGSGGSAQVFAAWDRQRRRSCCVKIYYPSPPHLRAAWRGQAVYVALAGLRHPSVVEVLDLGSLDWSGWPTHFLVSELIDGVPLDVWLRTGGDAASDVARRCRLAASLADAVRAAHTCRYLDDAGIEQTGLLHGDIKPANIMVRRDDTPVLLDFLDFRLVDLADLPDRDEPDDPVANTTMFGTRGHMAPEQERHGVLTRKSDVFGLGLVIGALFFGAFDAPGRDATLASPEVRLLPRWIVDAVAALTSPEAGQRPDDLTAIRDRFAAGARGGLRGRLAAGLAGLGWKW